MKTSCYKVTKSELVVVFVVAAVVAMRELVIWKHVKIRSQKF